MMKTTKKLLKQIKQIKDINEKTAPIHGLEDLILLRCQDFPK